MRSHVIPLLGVVLLTAGYTSLLVAQTPDAAEIMFEAAKAMELIDGDLEAAIEQYQAIVTRHPDRRAIVAKALLGMASGYEKLGQVRAREVYERLVREYADQATVLALAQEGLSRLTVESTPPSPALHAELLWAEAIGVSPQGGVSPDGSLVTYVDWLDDGNLAIRNLATGESRRLTHTADNGDNYAFNSRISPDGEQVLYDWARPSPVGETGELRLLPVHGDQTEPRTIWSPDDGSFTSVQDWFPSGDRVAAVVSSSGTRSIVTVSTVDGRVRQIRTIEWGGEEPLVRVSPDGRYLAYSRSASRQAPEPDIFLLAVDGSSEIVVVQHAASDELVAWSPGGTHLLFNSDRSGQPGLWAQRVQDAEPAGEPRLLVSNVDVGSGMGVTRDGTLHYPVRVSRRRLKIAELDTKTGRLLRQPVNATDQFVGGNREGVFSPDGETLAYVSDRRGWMERAIVVQSLKTGEERDIPHGLHLGVGPVRLSWRSDSDHLIARAQDDLGRYVLFDVNVATGETRSLPEIPGAVLKVWTPDGMQILHRNYLENPESIYSYSVTDGSVQALPGVFGGAFFSLSPDGQWIANVGGHRSETDDNYGRTEIRLHPVEGGDGDVLLATNESEPFGGWTTWTPDGTALLVLKQDAQAGEGMSKLWIVPVDGSEPVATELVYELANGGSAPIKFHPDGTRIVYAAGGYFSQFWALHNLALDSPDSP